MELKETPAQKCIHHDAAWWISKQRCENKSLFVPFSKDKRYQGLSRRVLVIVSKLEELLSRCLLTWPSISAACCNSQHHRRHGYNTALPHEPGRLYRCETDACFPLPAVRKFSQCMLFFVDISFIYQQWNQWRAWCQNLFQETVISWMGWKSIEEVYIHSYTDSHLYLCLLILADAFMQSNWAELLRIKGLV